MHRHDLQRNDGTDGNAGESITFADRLIHRALTSDPRLQVGNDAEATYAQILVQNLTGRNQLPEFTFTGVPETRVV